LWRSDTLSRGSSSRRSRGRVSGYCLRTRRGQWTMSTAGLLAHGSIQTSCSQELVPMISWWSRRIAYSMSACERQIHKIDRIIIGLGLGTCALLHHTLPLFRNSDLTYRTCTRFVLLSLYSHDCNSGVLCMYAFIMGLLSPRDFDVKFHKLLNFGDRSTNPD
jgi:hypothetical protein